MRVLLVVACWVAAGALASVALGISQRRLQRRNAIMGALIVHGPMTVVQLALATEENPNTLYHIARSMELDGILESYEEQPKELSIQVARGGRPRRFYRVSRVAL